MLIHPKDELVINAFILSLNFSNQIILNSVVEHFTSDSEFHIYIMQTADYRRGLCVTDTLLLRRFLGIVLLNEPSGLSRRFIRLSGRCRKSGVLYRMIRNQRLLSEVHKICENRR